MKLSEVYRKAAQDIDERKSYFCCEAIAKRGGFISEFEHRFKPARVQGYGVHGWYGPTISSAQNARVIALCLMAAIMESEGK